MSAAGFGGLTTGAFQVLNSGATLQIPYPQRVSDSTAVVFNGNSTFTLNRGGRWILTLDVFVSYQDLAVIVFILEVFVSGFTIDANPVQIFMPVGWAGTISLTRVIQETNPGNQSFITIQNIGPGPNVNLTRYFVTLKWVRP